jgi:hypothetical protein
VPVVPVFNNLALITMLELYLTRTRIIRRKKTRSATHLRYTVTTMRQNSELDIKIILYYALKTDENRCQDYRIRSDSTAPFGTETDTEVQGGSNMTGTDCV